MSGQIHDFNTTILGLCVKCIPDLFWACSGLCLTSNKRWIVLDATKNRDSFHSRSLMLARCSFHTVWHFQQFFFGYCQSVKNECWFERSGWEGTIDWLYRNWKRDPGLEIFVAFPTWHKSVFEPPRCAVSWSLRTFSQQLNRTNVEEW